jgi:hypothetical protein
MGHPAPGVINTADCPSSLGVWRQPVTVKETYPLGKQYYGLGKEAIKETMIQWEQWGQKIKYEYKNLPSHFDSFISRSSGSHLQPVRTRSPSLHTDIYVERWPHFFTLWLTSSFPKFSSNDSPTTSSVVYAVSVGLSAYPLKWSQHHFEHSLLKLYFRRLFE